MALLITWMMPKSTKMTTEIIVAIVTTMTSQKTMGRQRRIIINTVRVDDWVHNSGWICALLRAALFNNTLFFFV
jgi:hypothetical protein